MEWGWIILVVFPKETGSGSFPVVRKLTAAAANEEFRFEQNIKTGRKC
jgi:hypothetical protein